MDLLRSHPITSQRSTSFDLTRQALDDIVRESLAIVLPATLISVWAWAAFAVLFSNALTPTAYAALAAASISAFATYQLKDRHLRAAVACYLAGLLITVTLLIGAIGVWYCASESPALIWFSSPSVMPRLRPPRCWPRSPRPRGGRTTW